MGRPEVAIVHDYLTQRGGAERVVLSMLKAFPGAPLYTALYDADATYPEFADHDVRPLWTNRLTTLRRDHRRGLLLYPWAFSHLTVDADLVVCSSSGFAHGVRTTGRKVVYCHSPPRWLYDQADPYLAAWPRPVRAFVRAARPELRRWDKRAASSADRYLANSSVVQDRIWQTYGISAEVVPPPVPRLTSGSVTKAKRVSGFVLCVSRLLAYKNVDAILAAFDLLPETQLVVVGEGPELPRLKSLAGPNVTLLGRIDDAELDGLYTSCAGVVSASYEDFGLTAIEAASHGKPSAVLRFGGFLDTVTENKTGVFFAEPLAASIAEAVRLLLAREWDHESIRCEAEYFSEPSFIGRIRDAVAYGVVERPMRVNALRSAEPSPI